MNQGIAFARSIRALQADDFTSSTLGLLVALILLAAWTWWMLAARVPQYETTTNVRIESGRAIAYLPSQGIQGIRPGASAIIHLDGMSLPARVQSITSNHAELVIDNGQPLIAGSISASVDIESTPTSPATVILRTLSRGSR